ncbi:MAG TPA: MFS transporter [Anaerolineales bacterium]|nr:MFS transporter [Anaerolineales bacterium]
MKFNYGKIFLLGFGFFGVSVIWGVYNAFVPIFLANKFNISPSIIGIFMTFDNIAALFIQPPVGAWSDRVRTKLGRRIPFILFGAPISAVAFGFIPLAAVLPLFVACTSTLLLSAALWRTPVVALMPDITPSPFRSQANGIINFMGGIGTIVALQTGGVLFDLSPNFPFWLGSALVILAAAVVYFFIKEPTEYEVSQEEQTDSVSDFIAFAKSNTNISLIGLLVAFLLVVLLAMAFPGLRTTGSQIGLPPFLILFLIILVIWFVYIYVFYMARKVIFEEEKSGIRILLAIFFWFIGFSAVETFFTLYAEKHLGLTPGNGATLLSILPLFFVLFAVPTGFIASKIGRRKTISIGLMMIIVMMILLYITPAATLLTGIAPLPLVGIPLVDGGSRMLTIAGILLIFGGIGWAFININSLPMIVDLTSAEKIGAYTGLYYLFSTLSAVVGPISNGIAIELTNNNYNIIMALAPFFFGIALILMLGVRRGEATV